jgi:hypothetical protein
MLLSWFLPVLTLLACSQANPPARPVVTSGQGHFQVVRFPQRWMESGGQPGELITTRELEIRRDVRSPAKELFFGALSLESHRYSRNLYAVMIGNPKIRTLSTQRWEKAKRVDAKSEPLFPVSGYGKPNGVYEYSTKRYLETGKSGGAAGLSPDRKYLAVMSYTDAFERPQTMPPIGGGEAMQGTAYWDVYDTRSGRKVFAGQMAYKGQSAGIIFSSAVWVDEKYFVLPLDNQSQSFFIGRLTP